MQTWKLLDMSISHMDKEEGQGWAAANTPLHTVCAKFIKESQGQCNTFQLYTRDSAWSVFHSFQRDCLVNMMLRIRPRISFQTAAAARLPVSHETSSFRSLEQDSRTLMHWNRKCLYRLSGTAMCSQSDSCWNQILSLFQKLLGLFTSFLHFFFHALAGRDGVRSCPQLCVLSLRFSSYFI